MQAEAKLHQLFLNVCTFLPLRILLKESLSVHCHLTGSLWVLSIVPEPPAHHAKTERVWLCVPVCPQSEEENGTRAQEQNQGVCFDAAFYSDEIYSAEFSQWWLKEII